MRAPLLRLRGAPSWTCQKCRSRLNTSSGRRFSSNQAKVPGPKTKLPTSPARTRFAPSPTGYLHLGSLRTALYNYLLAKATGGQFLLRIEDTDTKRTVPDAETRLCEDLRWAGLHWDEGPEVGGPYGPYRQSERTSLYQEHAAKLVESRHAYRCFCSSERLESLAKERSLLGLPTNYDRTCADLSVSEADERASKGEGHVIRLKAPKYYPDFRDLVYGKISTRGVRHFHGETAYEDLILLKTDGLPTYHLANVVDDHYMRITHVIRATEWLATTPKHIELYNAFQWEPPAYAHVGLLQDTKGQKLSKRNMDLDISHFRDKMEVTPETLINFVALLGWSHGQVNDQMTMKELINNFEMKFTRGNAVVTFEKLGFLQKAHAHTLIQGGGLPFEKLVDKIKAHVESHISASERALVILDESRLSARISDILKQDGYNYTTPTAFLSRNDYFFRPLPSTLPDPTAIHAFVTQGENEVLLHKLATTCADHFSNLKRSVWTADHIQAQIKQISTALDSHNPAYVTTKLEGRLGDISFWDKKVKQYLRWAMAASKPGPSLTTVMAILGREVCIQRLADARRHLTKQAS